MAGEGVSHGVEGISLRSINSGVGRFSAGKEEAGSVIRKKVWAACRETKGMSLLGFCFVL